MKRDRLTKYKPANVRCLGSMAKLTATLILGLVAGCASVDTCSIYSREFVLSPQQPQDKVSKARLVQIAADGTTTIRSLITGETLHAQPGGFFTPGPYGTEGLRLISVSVEKQEAHFEQTESR